MVWWPPSADDGDVTDNSGTAGGAPRQAPRQAPRKEPWQWQPWQGVLAAGLAVVTAAAVTLVGGLTDPASADTVVTSVTRAVVALPDGTEHSARLGETLPRGAVVRTGPDGGARLTAAGRDVYVGALSTVGVTDGVRQTLDRGQVMVDSRDGARLTVTIDGDTVATPAGGLARIERGPVLRVAAFRGTTTVSPVGRQAATAVRALYQVTAQYGTVPSAPTALALRKDPWEQRLAADLTAADDDLIGFAQGLRGSQGTVVLAAARRDLIAGITDPTAAADQGERALSLALAEAGRAAAPTTNLVTVRDGRSSGGSWGVVAAIVRASVTDVSGRLSVSLAPGAGGGGLLAGPDGSTPGGAGLPGLPGLPGTVQPSGSPSPTPSRPASPTPTPTSSTSPRPPSATPGPVQQVVTLINDLLPDPIPTLGPLPLVPLQAPVQGPVATPTPLLQVGPLRVG